MDAEGSANLHEVPRLGSALGIDLWVQRDDLLPHPLAGNKFRKLLREMEGLAAGTVVITVGGPSSNHCRTTAMLAAQRGYECVLVVHDEHGVGTTRTLAMARDLGARIDVVPADAISRTLDAIEADVRRRGRSPHVIAGGCHTRAGVEAYRDAFVHVCAEEKFDVVVLASGTGATQAGLAVGAAQTGTTRVVGVSVARAQAQGTDAVRDAMGWIGAASLPVEFDDRFTFGGYERTAPELLDVVRQGWSHGLPLDPTYTGKAFFGLGALCRAGSIPRGARVLFWHTGGLMNYIEAMSLRDATSG